MDGGIAAAKDALKDNDDDWLVDDDESDEDEVVLKKRGKKKKATRKPKAATSSNSRGKKKSSPTPSANNVSLNYSRSSNLGKATILLRTKVATGQCVNDKDGVLKQ